MHRFAAAVLQPSDRILHTCPELPRRFRCAAIVPKGGGTFDLIVVGAQECAYSAKLKPTDYARFLTGKTEKLHNWFGQLHDHLGEQFIPVGCRELMEMRLIVFARQNVI